MLRDGSFTTADTGSDRRLDGHKYQGVLLAYTGVAVLDQRGALYGTLCHFDAIERQLSDENFDLLQQAARLLASYLDK